MQHPMVLSACALAASLAMQAIQAQTPIQAQADKEAVSDAKTAGTETVVVTGKRSQRVSKGATGLPLEIKDTPQSISTIDKEAIGNFDLSGANDALILGTGINVEQYETNRATYNTRGFEIQSTQLDGLGVTNSWGTVVGQQETYLFERIELIRGANGLLTGVGNASGTINYVRKRPTNADGGELGLSLGSYGRKRATLDYNKMLSDDGRWAGRLVLAHEDKDSHLRALHDKQTTLYAVVDGQIGRDGMLTLGLMHQDAKQKSPMWGSLTLNHTDGRQAEFDVSASTSQDWTYWNTRSTSAFVEYTHSLGTNWELKASYNTRRADESTRLFYAYTLGGGLNADNTGLVGWAYASSTPSESHILDLHLSGQFKAFGRKHHLIAGLSHSTDEYSTDILPVQASNCHFQALPAFPYAGNACSEPTWGASEPSSAGKQALTRLYLASRLELAQGLHGLVGVNAVRLRREGSSRYGSVPPTVYPDTQEVSPYLGLNYAFTPDVQGYASYSDIFQNQEQVDVNGHYLAPTQGKNHELGIKAEWLDKKLLTTFAVYGARQNGLAHYAGTVPVDNDPNTTRDGTYYYAPADVKSKGWEFEANGRIGRDTQLSAGVARVSLRDPNGLNAHPYVPKTTLTLRAETRLPLLAGLATGAALRWQDETSSTAGVRQPAYALVNAYARYDLSARTSLRLNINNLFDQKYIRGLAYGAIYGAPRTTSLSLNYKL